MPVNHPFKIEPLDYLSCLYTVAALNVLSQTDRFTFDFPDKFLAEQGAVGFFIFKVPNVREARFDSRYNFVDGFSFPHQFLPRTDFEHVVLSGDTWLYLPSRLPNTAPAQTLIQVSQVYNGRSSARAGNEPAFGICQIKMVK
jgi:hypothetical protein